MGILITKGGGVRAASPGRSVGRSRAPVVDCDRLGYAIVMGRFNDWMQALTESLCSTGGNEPGVWKRYEAKREGKVECPKCGFVRAILRRVVGRAVFNVICPGCGEILAEVCESLVDR